MEEAESDLQSDAVQLSVIDMTSPNQSSTSIGSAKLFLNHDLKCIKHKMRNVMQNEYAMAATASTSWILESSAVFAYRMFRFGYVHVP